MRKSLIVNKMTGIKIGSIVRMISIKDIETNSIEYGFELNNSILYRHYSDIDLEVVDMKIEEIRSDLKVLSLKVRPENKELIQTWLYYELEVVTKNKFVVELI